MDITLLGGAAVVVGFLAVGMFLAIRAYVRRRYPDRGWYVTRHFNSRLSWGMKVVGGPFASWNTAQASARRLKGTVEVRYHWVKPVDDVKYA